MPINFIIIQSILIKVSPPPLPRSENVALPTVYQDLYLRFTSYRQRLYLILMRKRRGVDFFINLVMFKEISVSVVGRFIAILD